MKKIIHLTVFLALIAGLAGAALGFANNMTAPVIAANDLKAEEETLRVIYPDGEFAMSASNAYLKTFSVSVPAYVGYHLYKSSLRAFGVKIYTGPTVELITSAKLDGYTYKDYNPFQIGWTVGTGVKLFYMFGFNVAYRYYPIAILENGNLVRSSVNFSFGF